jgi:hypothetical protein
LDLVLLRHALHKTAEDVNPDFVVTPLDALLPHHKTKIIAAIGPPRNRRRCWRELS